MSFLQFLGYFLVSFTIAKVIENGILFAFFLLKERSRNLEVEDFGEDLTGQHMNGSVKVHRIDSGEDLIKLIQELGGDTESKSEEDDDDDKKWH